MEEGFDNLVNERHPGTITGFGDVLCRHLEEYVNNLVLEYNKDKIESKKLKLGKYNTLYKKLRFLGGSSFDMYEYEDESKARLPSNPPVLTHIVFDFLDKLRSKCNDPF